MNNKIYFVAPSFGVTISPYKERFKVALKNFNKLGYECTIGDNVFKALDKVSSNTPINRAKEINSAFESDSDIIWSVGGGEVMSEILEYVDFELIKSKKDKVFVGYSDNTNLTFTIPTLTEIPAIYGVNAPSMSIIQYDSKDTIDMLNNKKSFKTYGKWQLNDNDESPIHPYQFDMKSRIKAYNYNEPLKGRLIGGCLDVLLGLCGTKFDNVANYNIKHKNEGVIFFMEACDLNSISLIRALTQLKNAGWFDNVDGFIIGRSLNYYDKSFGISMNEAYLRVLKPLNKPILLDVDLGHLSPSVPIYTGKIAKITYNRNRITFDYE